MRSRRLLAALAALLAIPALAQAAGHEFTPKQHERLTRALDIQGVPGKVRYRYRHPIETLEFFGIKPGMTVADVLPGDPWYAGILSPYLGEKGKVIGVGLPLAMYSSRDAADSERRRARERWPKSWVAEMKAKKFESDAPFAAFRAGALPRRMHNTADVAIVARALHGVHRLQVNEDAPHLRDLLADMRRVLKPGGTLGVVQHRAPQAHSDEWADGSNGYLKQSRVIEFIAEAGFEFVTASEINANPKDKPTEDDRVWRLPPSFRFGDADDEERARMQAIGESDRMTLLFRNKK